MDHYKTLGIERNASVDDIKKAYRKLSFQHHPDRSGENASVEIFQQVNEAHEILSDPHRRHEYDMELSMEAFGGGFFQGGMPGVHVFHGNVDEMEMDLGSMFNMFAMGGNPLRGGRGIHNLVNSFVNQMQKLPPITKTLELSLEEIYCGGSYELDIEKWSLEHNMKQYMFESINIFVPPGTNDGERIIITGEGNYVSENQKGDIIVDIKIKAHEKFVKEGNNLYYKHSLTLKEALCGFSFDIFHLNQQSFVFNNTQNVIIIKPGDKKILRQLGMKRENCVGDLVIIFDVIFPNQLDQDKIEQLKELL